MNLVHSRRIFGLCMVLLASAEAVFAISQDGGPHDGRHNQIFCETYLHGEMSKTAKSKIEKKLLDRPFVYREDSFPNSEFKKFLADMGLAKVSEVDRQKLILTVSREKDAIAGPILLRLGLLKGAQYQTAAEIPFPDEKPSSWQSLHVFDHELDYNYQQIAELYEDEMKGGLEGIGFHTDPDKNGVPRAKF